MSFAGLDYWAIFIAAVIGNVIGAVWYWGFSKPWMAGNDLTEESLKRNEAGIGSLAPYAVALVAQLIMATVLSAIVGHLGAGAVTLRGGMMAGALCWLGFVLTTMTVNHTFSFRKRALLFIDGGYWLVVLVVMGGIIGGLAVWRS